MTDISVFSQAFQFEDLSWDLTPVGSAFIIGGTLDTSLLNAGQHYPNGYLKSGFVIGKVTTGGLLGPYLDAAVDGRTKAVGILRASVKIARYGDGSVIPKIGVSVLVHGQVDPTKLPYTSGNAATGGYLDANGQADLPLIYFGA
jgi:hypothetical protein